MEYASRAELVNAVMAAILKLAADGFPTIEYATPDAIATAMSIEFETIKKPPYQDSYVFPEFFGENFSGLVRASVHWLSETGFLLSEDGNSYTKAVLSERGAKLMGCWPRCLRD